MKIFKLLVVAVVSLVFLVGLVSMALSTDIVRPPVMSKAKVNVGEITGCPTGWHLVSGSFSGAYTCVPNKTPTIKCPTGLEYFDNSAAGCAVGCREVIK